MQTLKYNYIIAGGSAFYDVVYDNLKRLPYVKYHNSFLSGINSKINRFLIKLNFNLKVNKFFKTPLDFLVFDKLYPSSFKDDKPLCFVFFECQFAVINTSYIYFLRKHYPSAKIVLYMQDVISSLPYYNVKDYKKKFDLILSYDKGDCRRYGFLYYPTPYSIIKVNQSIDDIDDIDVFFCGAGKNRYSEIMEAYRKCIKEGLKCIFFITGVPKDEQIAGEGLVYDQIISYKRNIAYVRKSKCILEIMQKNADGYTLRLWEAIMYNKHLLTNNINIVNSDYYMVNNIHLLTEDIPIKKWINSNVVYNNSLKENLSPKHLLEFIDNKITD